MHCRINILAQQFYSVKPQGNSYMYELGRDFPYLMRNSNYTVALIWLSVLEKLAMYWTRLSKIS